MPAQLPSLVPTPEAIERFKKLYKERFGKDLEPEKALDLARKTILLVYIGTTKPPKPNAD